MNARTENISVLKHQLLYTLHSIVGNYKDLRSKEINLKSSCNLEVRRKNQISMCLPVRHMLQ